MVVIRNSASKKFPSECRSTTVLGAILGGVVAIVVTLMVASGLLLMVAEQDAKTNLDSLFQNRVGQPLNETATSISTITANSAAMCPITKLAELSRSELHPIAGERHMVTPPDDNGSYIYLVCCNSTKGTFNAVLHHAWAPLGVQRLVDMITSGYFGASRIPLFRCLSKYPQACQFGLAGNPEWTRRYHSPLQDDPAWLPPGPAHRENEQGVKRYPAGMWTYAGSGPHSRSTQMVITLEANPFMGGGSPWEVPLGELVGAHSFETISKWYTGYGEQGPSQRIMHQEGDTERVQQQWPLMDYITACSIVDQQPPSTTTTSTIRR